MHPSAIRLWWLWRLWRPVGWTRLPWVHQQKHIRYMFKIFYCGASFSGKQNMVILCFLSYKQTLKSMWRLFFSLVIHFLSLNLIWYLSCVYDLRTSQKMLCYFNISKFLNFFFPMLGNFFFKRKKKILTWPTGLLLKHVGSTHLRINR